MTLLADMDRMTCFPWGWDDQRAAAAVEQGLPSPGLSKHLVGLYSKSGIRSTCHGDKSRPRAR